VFFFFFLHLFPQFFLLELHSCVEVSNRVENREPREGKKQETRRPYQLLRTSDLKIMRIFRLMENCEGQFNVIGGGLLTNDYEVVSVNYTDDLDLVRTMHGA